MYTFAASGTTLSVRSLIQPFVVMTTPDSAEAAVFRMRLKQAGIRNQTLKAAETSA